MKPLLTLFLIMIFHLLSFRGSYAYACESVDSSASKIIFTAIVDSAEISEDPYGGRVMVGLYYDIGISNVEYIGYKDTCMPETIRASFTNAKNYIGRKIVFISSPDFEDVTWLPLVSAICLPDDYVSKIDIRETLVNQGYTRHDDKLCSILD